MRAYIVRKRVSSSSGCLLEILGILPPILLGVFIPIVGFFIGIPIGIVFLVIGARATYKWQCNNCKNLLAARDVLICPTCHAELIK